jgi:RNA polymerase sigma-70 factor (ECF subfamily)
VTDDPAEEARLLDLAAAGDRSAAGELLAQHEPRLRRMARMRMDPRLVRRVGVSDVVQDVNAEAMQRLPQYVREPKMPFFLWLRFLTAQRIAALWRHHFGAQQRDARREVPLSADPRPQASSSAMAAQLTGGLTSPSSAAARDESERRVRGALDRLDPADREVLSLRHFEQLDNNETALELGIAPSAASKRYVRALRRLKDALAALPGGGDMLAP